ncbi:MAG: hypothetical protein H6609_16525 [Ignavibacteriales bacterium]|nr:hypothetical protein [Ignavibacteriales bacterium]
MAKVNQSVIGKLSGKLGDLVFRQMNGKTFISTRPKNYKPTKSKKAVSNRNSFSQINLFASTINKNETLKHIWLNAKIDAQSAYTKITKTNLKLSLNDGIDIKNIIVPKSKLFIDIIISLNKSDLKISCNKNSFDTITNKTNNLQCFILFFFSQPRKKGMIQYRASLFEVNKFIIDKEKIVFDLKNAIDKSYKKVVIFNTFIITNDTQIKNWSSTTANKFLLE